MWMAVISVKNSPCTHCFAEMRMAVNSVKGISLPVATQRSFDAWGIWQVATQKDVQVPIFKACLVHGSYSAVVGRADV